MEKSHLSRGSLLPETVPRSTFLYHKIARRKIQLLILTGLILSSLVSFQIWSVTLVNRHRTLQNQQTSKDSEKDFDYLRALEESEESESVKPVPNITNNNLLEPIYEYDDSQIVTNALIENQPLDDQPLEALVAKVLSNDNIVDYFVTDDMEQLDQTSTTAFNSSNGTLMDCQIPQMNPFDPSIIHLVEEPEPVKCTIDIDFPLLLSSSSYLNSTTLFAQRKNFSQNLDNRLKGCYYHILTRRNNDDDPDNSVTLSAKRYPLPLNSSSVSILSPEHEYLVITCDIEETEDYHTKDEIEETTRMALPLSDSTDDPEDPEEISHGDNQEIFKDIYSKVVDLQILIPKKLEVEQRIESYYKRISSNLDGGTFTEVPLPEDERLNIAVFGIDAVSRMNFIRTFPQSYSFLMNNLSALEMKGFNKIGDNTYPNLAAALTSQNKSTLESVCEDNYFFDDCPFIWKKFAMNGYRTSFAEDSPWMSAFNYMKNGFRNPPTDYYLRPFLVAAEELIGSEKTLNANLCYGSRLTFEVMLDYLREMAYSMGQDRRYFQFIWATSLTHDFLNYGRLGDPHLLSTLKWFQEGGYLNKTIFVLMSDHGIRWGDIHDYLQGQLEERLPFLYFVVPEWFQNKYGTAFQNLKLNQERLTTHFDFHETLLDLLNMRQLEEPVISVREANLAESDKSKRLPRGISQFLPIPVSRTCEMAGIEGHYCTCHRLEEVPTNSSEVEQAANFLVYKLNSIVADHPECGLLSLDNIRTAHLIDFSNAEVEKGWKGYELAVKTKPGYGVFSASLKKNEEGTWQVSGPIGRTNLYGNQSHCVNEKELKLYCYCVDLLG